MNHHSRLYQFLFRACLVFVLLASLHFTPSAPAYIGGPPLSLGLMCGWSTHVMIAKVDQVDREKNVIVFRKVRDVKGKWPAEMVRHRFAPNWPNRAYVFDWAEPGKTVVICALESYKWSHIYIDREWYAANTADWQWWNVSHSEPLLLRMYAGKTDRLADAVVQIVAGREVVVPGMVDGPVEDLVKRRAKFQRLRASLKLSDYNPKRDFVNWGNDDFDSLSGMPGFSHAAGLARLGSDAIGIASADFDGDGKPDLCLYGANKIFLALNGGDYFNEILLPGFHGGCRSLVAADYNGDARPDLLLATARGPRLFTNLGQGNFRDDTQLLPSGDIFTLSAAAWIDYDCDGQPDILLANGYHGLKLYRNKGPKSQESGVKIKPAVKEKSNTPPLPWFEDVSDKVGLGIQGFGAGNKADCLSVCDVDGDGCPDFLFGDALFLNCPHGFVPVKNSGLSFIPGKVGPIFGDFNGDGIPDLFIPQNGQGKLFKGDGHGRFIDVTAQAGDLARAIPWATSAAWGDFDNDGHLDLIVGCLRGPNRFFRNRGDSTFEEATEKVGLHRRLFNSQSVCLLDLNGDGFLDLVCNNEGQDAVVLLGNPDKGSSHMPVTLAIAGGEGIIGSQVQIWNAKGKLVKKQEISGGNGRCQPPGQVHLALEPGTYRVQVRFSSGQVRTQEITTSRSAFLGKIDFRETVKGP